MKPFYIEDAQPAHFIFNTPPFLFTDKANYYNYILDLSLTKKNK